MADWLVDYDRWILSLHVISVMFWMAGMYYLPRLFVYHAEAMESDQPYKIFEKMEYNLLRIIMNPAMIASWLLGLALILTPGAIDWSAAWPYTKFAAIIGMTWFHMWCGARRKDLMADGQQRSGRHYRLMNEVPTVLLIVIIVSVIARPF